MRINIFNNMIFFFCFMNTKSILNKLSNNFKPSIKNSSNLLCQPNHIIKKNIYLFMKKETKDIKNMSPIYKPKGVNQELYCKHLNDRKVELVFGIGPAGSGKTLFACEKAINELNSGNVQKIILTRPVVSVEEEIGYLPGSIVNKMDPWTKPIMDIFLEYYSQKDLQSMINSNIIEVSPLAFMRGRTFKRSFIIADEMQNSSPNQMLMLITRIGMNSKMVITGDINQSDRGKDNGLTDVLKKIMHFNKINETDTIKVVELTSQDIERSEIVKQIIKIYDYSNLPKTTETVKKEIVKKEIVKKEIMKKDIIKKDIVKKEDNKASKVIDCNNFINNDASLIPISGFPRNNFTL